MTHIIDFDFGEMYESFERLQDEVYLMYHVHPTYIPQLPITSAERQEIFEMEAFGNFISGDAVHNPNKVVQFLR